MKRLLIPFLAILALTAIAVAFSALSVPPAAAEAKPLVQVKNEDEKSCCDKVDKAAAMVSSKTSSDCCEVKKSDCATADCEESKASAVTH